MVVCSTQELEQLSQKNLVFMTSTIEVGATGQNLYLPHHAITNSLLGPLGEGGVIVFAIRCALLTSQEQMCRFGFFSQK